MTRNMNEHMRRNWASAGGVLAMVVVGVVGSVALGDVVGSGGHLFESDFLGSSNEVYFTNGARPLVEGWNGERFGPHGGTSFPTSTVENGILSYRGGGGSYSDRVNITRDLSGIPDEWMLQVRFRRDGGHNSARNDFSMLIDGEWYVAGGGGSSGENAFGIAGNTIAYELETGTWYTMEVIDRRVFEGAGGPTGINLQGDNFSAPQRSVDWITMDGAVAGWMDLEMRIWADEEARPEAAQVFIVPSPGSVSLLLVGGMIGVRRRRVC